jgi:hypothetical protein
LPIISLDTIQNELAEQSSIAEQKETARIAAGRKWLGSRDQGSNLGPAD